jgi:hypothetical protein
MSDGIIHIAADGACEACGRPFRIMDDRALTEWDRRLCSNCLIEAIHTWMSIYEHDEEWRDRFCEHVLVSRQETADLVFTENLIMNDWQLTSPSGLVLGVFRCRACGQSWPSESAATPAGEAGPSGPPLPRIPSKIFVLVMAATLALLMLTTAWFTNSRFGWW